MIRDVSSYTKSCWRSLVLTDVLFKILALGILTPLVGLTFRGFLKISGRSVLADADIARFLLHPIGWAALTVVGGAIVAILAMEQSALMSMSLVSAQEQSMGVLGALRYVAGRATEILRLTARMVVYVFLLAAPFVAVGGGLYLLLLTDHDINFYLTHKPPKFWIAVGLIGTVLAALAAVLIRCIVSWAVAIPLLLFEGVPPSDCLAASGQRIVGHRKQVATWVTVWFVVNTIIAAVATGLVIQIGTWIVPGSTESVWLLAATLGCMLLLWGFVNLATNLLGVISFSVLLAIAYDRFGRTESCRLPDQSQASDVWTWRWSRGRVIGLCVLLVAGMTSVGIVAVQTVRLEDDVEITAHRGASGRAPENTLASVQAAIEDDADWVEIDVQESKDGVVVVAHDSDLMKVSGNNVKIWEATAEELRSIDIGSYFGSEFADERIPTLTEVLETCRGKVRVNIELKYYGHDENLEQKVIDLVESHGMESDVVIMSLESKGVAKVRELRPSWTVGLLSAVSVSDLTRVDADFLAVNTKLATRPFIRSAHRQEKNVYVWTLNDAVTMSTMISRGADNLITDYPELAREVLAERAEMSPLERVLLEFAFLFGVGPKEPVEQ